MLFGYLAAMLGRLLHTTVPNWTGRLFAAGHAESAALHLARRTDRGLLIGVESDARLPVRSTRHLSLSLRRGFVAAASGPTSMTRSGRS